MTETIRHRTESPSLRLAVRDAKKAMEGMPTTGVVIEVPIEALQWLVYGTESFIKGDTNEG